MKTLTKTIAAITLMLTIFSFNAFADCGDQENGNRCLVSTSTPRSTTTEKKEYLDMSQQLRVILRSVFRKLI